MDLEFVPLTTNEYTLQTYDYPHPEDMNARIELAGALREGDVILVRIQGDGKPTLLRKVIYFGQNVCKYGLSTATHRLRKQHARVVHAGLVTQVEPVAGLVRITESVAAGTQTIDLFRHQDVQLNPGVGVVYDIYRLNPTDGATQSTTNRINAIACQLMQDSAAPVRKSRGIGKLRNRFAHAYSVRKAVRSIFFRAWGRRASSERVVRTLLKDYFVFIPQRELAWDEGRVRKKMCSQLVSSRSQLAEFEEVLNVLEESPHLFETHTQHKLFVEDVERARNPNFQFKMQHSRFLRDMTQRWSQLIYDHMIFYRYNSRFASPMELCEMMESSDGFIHAVRIEPARTPPQSS